MATPGFRTGGKTPAYEFTQEEWDSEGRQPPWDEWVILREQRKPELKKSKGIDFDNYVPWYLRDDFRLRRLADFDEGRATWLSRHKRYDEIMELRWLKAAEQNALNDG